MALFFQTYASAEDRIELLASPVIDNISKTIFTDGETLKINGSNFGNTRGASYVSFGAVAATDYQEWSDASIVVRVPQGIASGKLTVWVSGTQSNGIDYTYQKKFKLFEMVNIQAGTFIMGDESGSGFDNVPAHSVTITDDFEICANEVSQKDWKLVMDGSNPSQITDTGDAKPVQQVTFTRAAEFCNRLSQLEGLPPVYTIDGDNVTWDTKLTGYRLPTEAEWEYVARDGRTTDYTTEEVLEMGWVSENAGNHTQPIRTKKPNEKGIYDLFGNVAEMCWDYYDSDFYANSPRRNPIGPHESSFKDRIVRGGSFVNGADMCDIILRGSFPATASNFIYYLGLRVARSKVSMSAGEQSNSLIGIYPNPASDYIEITTGNVILSEAKNPRIFDLLGMEITTPALRATPPYQGGEKVRIDVSYLSPGVYFVRVGDVVSKFIKI
jgi:formylglycine-generating enzyme required for sulfatase activity